MNIPVVNYARRKIKITRMKTILKAAINHDINPSNRGNPTNEKLRQNRKPIRSWSYKIRSWIRWDQLSCGISSQCRTRLVRLWFVVTLGPDMLRLSERVMPWSRSASMMRLHLGTQIFSQILVKMLCDIVDRMMMELSTELV